MRPKVIINHIDSTSLNFNQDLRHTVTKSDIKELSEKYNKMNITKTFDGENPYVIIKCYIDELDHSDRNFEPIW